MKKAKLKKPTITKEQLKLARRYESSWHYLFNQLPKWKQKCIIDEPQGRQSEEFTKEVVALAESNEKDIPNDE
jgi:sRNA-binding protein